MTLCILLFLFLLFHFRERFFYSSLIMREHPRTEALESTLGLNREGDEVTSCLVGQLPTGQDDEKGRGRCVGGSIIRRKVAAQEAM